MEQESITDSIYKIGDYYKAAKEEFELGADVVTVLLPGNTITYVKDKNGEIRVKK